MLARNQVCAEKLPFSKKTIQYRKYKSIDMESFKADLINSRLQNIASNDREVLIQIFNDELRDQLKKHAPVKTRELTTRPLSPWHTEDNHALRKDEAKTEKQWRRTGLTVHREIYINTKNKLTKEIKKSKRTYLQAQISSSTQSQKTLFRCTDSFFRKCNQISLPSVALPSRLPNMFNAFFLQMV